MSLVIICYFICTTYLLTPCQTFKMLGPADLIYKTFERCETKESDIDVWITQRKLNRTTNVLDIQFGSPWPIDDDLILELKAEVKKDGGFKPGSFHIKDTTCNVLSTMLGEVFLEFLQVSGTDECPIPEGAYEIKDFYFDNDKFTVPQLYGEYRIRVNIFKDEALKGCYFLFLDMVPKEGG